jgi:hypothetical protein
MRMLVYSMAPIFKDHVHGGSQKILRELLRHLGKDHTVKVLCTKREDNGQDFELFNNVLVSPSLPFKETYPEPYYTAPYNLATAVERIQRNIAQNDVTYVHDSEMNFFLLFDQNKPFVTSLRDFV